MATLPVDIPGAGSAEIVLEGTPVALTSLDRVLWPRTGFSKRDLVEYYVAVAPALLPHVAGRALTLGRFPDGVDGRGFAQTECRGAPPWLGTATVVTSAGATRRYCVATDTRALAWAANRSTIELHPFLWLAAQPDEPTAVVFDLDPGPPAGMVECCDVALELRRLLDGLGLTALPKTSGSAGLHVYVPLARGHSFAATKAFAREVARELADERPALVVDRAAKSERRGRVLVDWLQNDATRSTVAAYSLRAGDWPLVSTPVAWDEVAHAAETGSPAGLVFDAGAVLARVAGLGDLFAPVAELSQRLP